MLERRFDGKMISLQKHIDIAAKLAANLFEQFGEVSPLVHAIDANGTHLILAVPQLGGSDEEKDIISEQLRRTFAEKNVVQYVIIVEAWFLSLPPGSSFERPSQSPHRLEAISISAESKTAALAMMIEIKRPAGGKPHLIREEAYTPSLQAGRLTGLLRPTETHH